MCRLVALALALALAGCQDEHASNDARFGDAAIVRGTLPDPVSARAAPPASSGPLPPRQPPASAAEVLVPAGDVLAGSLPGTPGRRPSREADEVRVAMPAFRIDRLPFPNDPGTPPRLVASRAEAASLCAARGARLCTELEWERACEGDANDPFPGGRSPDPERASSFGVVHMGTEAPEWTASEVPPEHARRGRSAVLRGARADAPAELHRCAARTFEVPSGATPAAFRCCVGPASPDYPSIELHAEFRDLTLSTEAIRAALRSVAELAPYADAFVPHGPDDGDRALARGGVGRGALAGWELATGPFAWSPAPGELAWVVSGTSSGATLLAVLYPLPDGRFAHAASFVLEGEELPVAIARTPASRAELRWSPCWGCAGENGLVRFEDDATIQVILR